MFGKFKFYTFLMALACLAAIFSASSLMAASSAGNAGRAQLREELIKLLQEEPEIVLDILRDNSEVVLDVAQQGSELRRLKILKAQWQNDLKTSKNARLTGRPALGPDNAPVTIVAFTDFTCAYCAQGEKAIGNIYESYKGKVRIVYKSLPMPTHPGSVEASQFMLAAYMQDKNKSWKLFHNFFDNRGRILANDSHAFLRAAAIEAGLNMTKLQEDARSSKVQKMLEEDEQDADALGFEGTPSFLVNNIVVKGALQENLFREAVEMALQDAEKKK